MNCQQSSFQEKEIYLRDYWRVIIKYRWTISAVFTIVLATVALVTFKMVPLYKATSQILIDRENSPLLSIKETSPRDAQDVNYCQTQYKILQSRSLAKTVASTLNLAHHKEFFACSSGKRRGNSIILLADLLRDSLAFLLPSSLSSPRSAKAMASSEKLTSQEESNLIDDFHAKLRIEPIPNSQLVNISFLAHDPALAAQVVNTLIDNYIQYNLNLQNEASANASDWLTQNIGNLKKKVEDSEEALQSYKEQNKIFSLEEKQNIIVQKLSELSSAITNAKTERIRLETIYNQAQKLRKNNEMLESLPAVINSSLIQDLKKSYIALQGEYDRESKQYGLKHPHIIKINSQLTTLAKRIDSEVQKIVSSIRTEYDVALAQEKVLVEAINELKGEALDLNKKAIQYKVLSRDAESNQKMFEVVLSRLKETDLTRGLKSGNLRIIDRAEVPDTPIRPKGKVNLMLGAIIGLFMGLGTAFFLEYLDSTVKTPEDLNRYCDLPSLGAIPHMDREETTGLACCELMALHKPKSRTSEAYKGLRTNIVFSFPENSPHSLLITSSTSQEGKTVTSINLALTMAQGEARVIIIDCNMRTPRLHHILEISNKKGISDLLAGQSSLDQVIQDGPLSHLKIITCGQHLSNPSELLMSVQLKNALQELKTRYDYIIIDSPPLETVTDSVIISRIVDGVILVLQGGSTSSEVIKRSHNLLKNAGAPILGAIINNINLDRRV